jgi:hypothetical protein
MLGPSEMHCWFLVHFYPCEQSPEPLALWDKADRHAQTGGVMGPAVMLLTVAKAARLLLAQCVLALGPCSPHPGDTASCFLLLSALPIAVANVLA